MDEPLVISTELYKYWHVDFQNETIRIVFQDGRIVEEELRSGSKTTGSQIASSTFDWEKWWVMSMTTKGDLIITEGFNPASPPPFNGRPSIYLDQNRWRTVSDVLHDPTRVKDAAERRAAQDLINFASDGRIVLPLSIGHMLETEGLFGERRYEVGLTMAKLAGGWQIRDPLDIWKHEAEVTIRGHLMLSEGAPVVHPVSTEPGALFGSETTLGISDEMPDADKFLAMLTMPCVVLDTLVDPERAPKHQLAKWVDHHLRITKQMQAENISKHQRRRLARRRYWNENIAFYMAAYRRLTRATDFPMFSDSELDELLSLSPMVGLLSELFVRRFIDRKTKWCRNDLFDMLHLSSAAAYADYVCAEVHTGTQLRQAQRTMGREETVFTKLEELVEAVRDDVAGPEH
jgi:hypothetical protein